MAQDRRDGVKVLWRSHLVWLGFEGSNPDMHLIASYRKLFVTCSCCSFLFLSITAPQVERKW